MTTRAEDIFRAVLASARSGEGGQGMPDSTWTGLDWDLLCVRLADHCTTEDASELARVLGVLPLSIAPRRQEEVREALGLRASGASAPIGDVPQLRHAILRCRKLDALDAEDLLGLSALLVAAARVRRFFAQHSERAPLLNEHAQGLREHSPLAHDIRSTFDDAGLMKDEASPELSRLRRRHRRIRDSILAKTDKYLRDPRYSHILQEGFVTLREERFVLPVRAGERGDVPGIVHGQSGSGGTLFIEPEELVPLNNELATVHAEVVREEIRVRSVLTARLREVIDDVEFDADLLAYLDLTHAQARLAEEMNAGPVILRGEGASFALISSRHPVLALRGRAEGFAVVPNDILVGDGVHALIISGPNTGGKTVTLKTLGLYALMLRAGMLLPASADSTIRPFRRVFTDIGDEQSIQADLSTFSGHVANIASFVTEVETGDLVLLDELFAGTDPAQATTLGRALIDDLIGRGAFVVVTTHLEGLKSVAFEDDRYAAASMGFDIDAMAPTYRLRQGVPGASWAHRIALRLGMPAAIVERAERMDAPSGAAVDEQALARIEDAIRRAENDRAVAATLREAAQRDREEASSELERAKDRQRRQLDEEVEKLRRDAREARESIREIQRKMRRILAEERPTDDDVARIIAEAREAVKRVEEREQLARTSEQDKLPPLDAGRLKKGDRVWVTAYQHYGVVAEPVDDVNSIAVQMGPVLVRVRIDQLRTAQAVDSPSAKKASVERAEIRPRFGEDEELSVRVDLRGQRVEDAEEMVEAYMQKASRSHLPYVLFIHGHGTGALRRAVRAKLHALPYRLEIRPGEQGEGGEGVTVAEFVSDDPRP